jgi:hypothetical protein
VKKRRFRVVLLRFRWWHFIAKASVKHAFDFEINISTYHRVIGLHRIEMQFSR